MVFEKVTLDRKWSVSGTPGARGGQGHQETYFGVVELTVISAWSIAINADDEFVGLCTMSDKVWLPG